MNTNTEGISLFQFNVSFPAKRATCVIAKDCSSMSCPAGNNAVCEHGHCDCGDHVAVGKRAGRYKGYELV